METKPDSAASELSAGLERTRITERELIALIRASSRHQIVECAYAPCWTVLLPTQQNQWAFDALKEMRSNAGIQRASPASGEAPLE